MKKIKCFIFDLDGTLVNTGPDLIISLNHVLSKNNLKALDKNEIGNLVGGGAGLMIKKAFDYYNKPIGKEKLRNLVNDFLVYYEKNCSVKSVPYKDIRKVLKFLKKKMITLAVCTNKKQYLANKVLSNLNLDNFFEIIIGSQDKFKLKPDTEMLSIILKKLEFKNDEVIMVGDSTNDIIPSNALGIKNIFVDFGYGKLNNHKANYKISSYEEIFNLFN